MEFPKLALGMRRDGGLSSFESEFVLAQGKLFKSDFDFLGILLEHLLEYRYQPGTIRSLKVTEHDHGNRCTGHALKGCLQRIDGLDEADPHHLDGGALTVQQKEGVAARTRLDLIDVPADIDGILVLAVGAVNQDSAIVRQNIDPALVRRH